LQTATPLFSNKLVKILRNISTIVEVATLTDLNKIWHGMGDYVGDATQYATWHVNRFRGVTPTKGWNVNGLCFFKICSL